MSDASRALAMGHLAVHAHTVRVIEALRDAGVDCLVLKGVSHELWLYPDGGRPVSRDVDVLVHPAQLDRACDAVRKLGMKPARDLAGPKELGAELAFVGGGVPVEVHTSFKLIRVPAERAWALLSAEREQIDVGGARMDVPSLAARAVVSVLHVARHGQTADWALEDLRRAIEVISLQEWRSAAELAEELDAGGAFSSGLRLLREGRRVADGLGLPESADPVLRLRASSANRQAVKMAEYTARPGALPLARLARNELIPPASRMRTWYPLARRGWTGLLAAYAVRLVRLGMSSRTLVSDWRRARSLTR